MEVITFKQAKENLIQLWKIVKENKKQKEAMINMKSDGRNVLHINTIISI